MPILLMKLVGFVLALVLLGLGSAALAYPRDSAIKGTLYASPFGALAGALIWACFFR